jgi:hypothetical protein
MPPNSWLTFPVIKSRKLKSSINSQSYNSQVASKSEVLCCRSCLNSRKRRIYSPTQSKAVWRMLAKLLEKFSPTISGRSSRCHKKLPQLKTPQIFRIPRSPLLKKHKKIHQRQSLRKHRRKHPRKGPPYRNKSSLMIRSSQKGRGGRAMTTLKMWLAMTMTYLGNSTETSSIRTLMAS